MSSGYQSWGIILSVENQYGMPPDYSLGSSRTICNFSVTLNSLKKSTLYSVGSVVIRRVLVSWLSRFKVPNIAKQLSKNACLEVNCFGPNSRLNVRQTRAQNQRSLIVFCNYKFCFDDHDFLCSLRMKLGFFTFRCHWHLSGSF